MVAVIRSDTNGDRALIYRISDLPATVHSKLFAFWFKIANCSWLKSAWLIEFDQALFVFAIENLQGKQVGGISLYSRDDPAEVSVLEEAIPEV